MRNGWIVGCVLLSACGGEAAGVPLGVGGGGVVHSGEGGSAGTSEGGVGGVLVNVAGAAGSAGAGTSGSGAGGAGGAGGATSCNTLVNAAPVIHEIAMMGTAPDPLGGTIADGTYYETSYTVYTGKAQPVQSTTAHQLTAKIEGKSFQAVFQDETATEQRITLELTPSGTAVSEYQTCRTNTKYMMNALGTPGYDATPTTFTFHLAEDMMTQTFTVYTLTKQ